MSASTQVQPRQFPCKQCGANLVFAPGTNSLKCGYCGTLNELKLDADVAELDFNQWIEVAQNEQPSHQTMVFNCEGCGGETQLPDGQVSGDCPFCGRAVVATPSTKQVIKPGGVVPFVISDINAKQQFTQWIEQRWFAPNKLKSQVNAGGLRGIYLPAWTYDTQTTTEYTGQRGDDYQDTETYTDFENGKPVTRTRTVTRTSWHGVSGTVVDTFDDVLVLADKMLPADMRRYVSNWQTKGVVKYEDDFLAGFVAESYQVDLKQGFELAKQMMEPVIKQSITSDIGGDHQRINNMSPTYRMVTFKHILVPIWLSAYQYNNKTYRFIINGQTGIVTGERPYSTTKITLVISTILLFILTLILLFKR